MPLEGNLSSGLGHLSGAALHALIAQRYLRSEAPRAAASLLGGLAGLDGSDWDLEAPLLELTGQGGLPVTEVR